MLPLLVTLLVSAMPQASGQWPALATVLRESGLAVPPGVEGGQTITSFAVLDDTRAFAIAYYDVNPDGLLHELVIRRFDKARRTWAAATFESIGSVLAFERHGGFYFVVGHSSPSDGPLLVLAPDLRLRHRTGGWIEAALPDGRVVFNRGMRHVSPTHAQVLAIYDPAVNRDVDVYPARADNDRGAEPVPGTDLWMDRQIDSVKASSDGRTIGFTVTEQHMRITASQMPEAAGPKRSFGVSCSMTARPVCRPQS